MKKIIDIKFKDIKEGQRLYFYDKDWNENCVDDVEVKGIDDLGDSTIFRCKDIMECKYDIEISNEKLNDTKAVINKSTKTIYIWTSWASARIGAIDILKNIDTKEARTSVRFYRKRLYKSGYIDALN